jgi:hypothetical protein
MYSLYDFFDKCLKSSPVLLSAGAGDDEIYWKGLEGAANTRQKTSAGKKGAKNVN